MKLTAHEIDLFRLGITAVIRKSPSAYKFFQQWQRTNSIYTVDTDELVDLLADLSKRQKQDMSQAAQTQQTDYPRI